MSELSKLKKENKRLKSLLKNAVKLLNTYKEYLKHPAAAAIAATATAGKKVQAKKPPKKAAKAK